MKCIISFNWFSTCFIQLIRISAHLGAFNVLAKTSSSAELFKIYEFPKLPSLDFFDSWPLFFWLLICPFLEPPLVKVFIMSILHEMKQEKTEDLEKDIKELQNVINQNEKKMQKIALL